MVSAYKVCFMVFRLRSENGIRIHYNRHRSDAVHTHTMLRNKFVM